MGITVDKWIWEASLNEESKTQCVKETVRRMV